MTLWTEICDLVTRDQVARLADRLVTLTEEERAELSGRLPGLVKELRRARTEQVRADHPDDFVRRVGHCTRATRRPQAGSSGARTGLTEVSRGVERRRAVDAVPAGAPPGGRSLHHSVRGDTATAAWRCSSRQAGPCLT
ncbi:hypothetical protein GCM10018952_44590 [Streptosporangium vulgare]